ncbi:MAG TPA: Uma2 family endonuclease [Kofleriaceae bacterium]|nr:Uma2 family endonuclease [Kofleriaceae bacterium]
MPSPAHRRRYTLTDYLEVEELSPAVKHELVDGEIFAMAGGTVEHAALSTSISALLVAKLRGGPCRAYSSDLRIRILEASIATYADVTVVCDPVERDPESPTHVTNPRVVIEVLSKSTESYDRDEKRLYYQQLQSLGEYVLVAQDRRRVEVWRRAGDAWAHSIHEAGAKVPLSSIGVELDVNEIYEVAGL